MSYRDTDKNRKYQRERVRKIRKEFFSDKKCVLCGSTNNLELDHIDRRSKVKKYDHNVWSWSEKRRLEELKKCQVLCHDCHKAKTIRELKENKPEHGSTGYRNGCRCDVCRSAETKRMRSYRARLKNAG